MTRRPPSGLTLPHLLTRSLLHRRARSLSALVALTVSAAITTALLTLYADLDTKLHREFRSFGANLIATAPAGGSLPPDTLQRAQQIAGPDARLAAFGYAVVTTDRGTPVVLAGTDLDAARRLNTWWSVTGTSSGDQNQTPATRSDPERAEPARGKPVGGEAEDQHLLLTSNGPETQTQSSPPAALLGAKAARSIAGTGTFRLTYNNRTITFRTFGTLRTGGDEDSRVYTSLEAFTALTGAGPGVVELQIPGPRTHVESTLSALHRELPGLTVAPVRQLVEGENRIVDRTHALMFGAVVLVALTVAISVLATLSAAVLERRRDFALMKALGGSQRQLTFQFLLETFTLSITGVLAGFLLGSAVAWVIGRVNFGTSTSPHPGVLPAVLLLNLAVAAAAAVLPSRSLRLLEPAALLKGD